MPNNSSERSDTKLYSDGNFYDTVNDPEEINPIKEGEGNTEAEKARKKLEIWTAKLD